MRPLRRGRLHVGGQQIDHLAIRLRNGIADDHLALVVVAHYPQHAADALKRGAVDQALVFRHKAQSGHTVGDGDDVVFAAERADNGISQRSIIFGHRVVSCFISKVRLHRVQR
ncbi:hypothetical protein D3C76_1496930 [compost metagenome]